MKAMEAAAQAATVAADAATAKQKVVGGVICNRVFVAAPPKQHHPVALIYQSS